jgi:hypothetical protein
LATKAAAARSLLKAGIFFFIGIDLLLVHVPGTDRPDQKFIALAAKRKYDEHPTSFLGSTDCAEAFFPMRMSRVRENGQ